MQKEEQVTKENVKNAFFANIQAVVNSGVSADKAIPTMSDLGAANRNPIGNADQSGSTTTQQVPPSDVSSARSLIAAAGNAMTDEFGKVQSISAENIYKGICQAYHALGCFHKYTTYWKFRRGGGIETRKTLTGYATFKPAMGALPLGWTASTRNGSVDITDAENELKESDRIEAAGLTKQLAKATDAWKKSYESTIEYSYTTCHANCHCHGNCHDNRGRR